ncbi:MAG: ATP-binding protein [Pseudomonadota bacterium]|nr:ATP-binding protein [Pseudomonadota bacterium]
MSWLRSLSIKQKLLLVTLLTLVAAVVLTATLFMAYERAQSRDRLAREIATIAQVIQSQLVAALQFEDLATLQETANSLDYDVSVELVCIYDQQMRLKVRSFPRAEAAGSCPHNPQAGGAGFQDGGYLYVENLYFESVRVGTMFIRVNLAHMDQQLAHYFSMLLTALALVSMVSILVAILTQKLVTDPIIRLAAAASRIAADQDFSVRVQGHGDDEIAQLIRAFNTMLAAIEERDRALSSQRAELEARVEERTAELKTTNQELQAFSYSVSHDLRPPLRAINGFSETLLEDYGSQLAPAARDYLQRVRLAGQRMGSLIDSLLWLSRVTRQEIVAQWTDFSALCDGVVQELREQSPQQRGQIRVQPGMRVRCDPGLMRVVISNLLENALKYSQHSPTPTIEVGERNGVYYVSDNGTGFDMRYADKLFSAFQRLHGNEAFEGIGVGLATVARVIHRHGGDIWAESEPGQGAVFYFTLAPEPVAGDAPGTESLT